MEANGESHIAVAEIVCTACSCLCDDIRVELEGNGIAGIENACLKGAAFLRAIADPRRRSPCLVAGREVAFEQSLEEAGRLLRAANNPLIFGLDNSTLEAQAVGIELARSLGAVLDDTSSVCQGTLVEHILSGAIPSCTLAEAKDYSDLMIYWGSNAHHSHPRHLSRYTYYSRDRYREAGWMPQVTMACVEVRDTETSSLCYPCIRLEPGGDRGFIEGLLATLRGRGEVGKELAQQLKTASFCVIFAGLGLTYALDNDFSPLIELVSQIGRSARVAVIPMVGHFNMRGLNQSLFQATGCVNRVSFANGVGHGEQFSLLGQVRDRAADCLLVVGSDPLSNLPQEVMANLAGVPIICLDPFPTATTRAAAVVLGTAASGIEVGGHAIRMDGVEVELRPARAAGFPSDEEVLNRLLAGA